VCGGNRAGVLALAVDGTHIFPESCKDYRGQSSPAIHAAR
jgi:hypothetical protein